MHQKFSGKCYGSKVNPNGDPLCALGLSESAQLQNVL